MGSLPRQKSPGRYMDGTLHKNLEILARNIIRDMTFLMFIFSSTLEVGTGKSVFVQQVSEALTELVNKYHKRKIDFTMNNIVFRPKDLIDRSFKVPKLSVVVLDEWEDTHYWAELGMSLRQFFRKCRQLNLFIICIIPNFFQLPIGYAISRSVFAIDVKFAGEFKRGFFDFYNFKRKKGLYLKGKKNYDYDVVYPNFSGRFVDGYVVGEKEYNKAKYDDMIRVDEERKKKPITEKEIIKKTFTKLRTNMPQITLKKWAIGFGCSERTITRWAGKERVEVDMG